MLRKAFRAIFRRGITTQGIEHVKTALTRAGARDSTDSSGNKNVVVVYAPTHKSHVDYLLLSFVLYQNHLRVPYIAAGDNLQIPLISTLLRYSGAFFIRRKRNNLEDTDYQNHPLVRKLGRIKNNDQRTKTQQSHNTGSPNNNTNNDLHDTCSSSIKEVLAAEQQVYNSMMKSYIWRLMAVGHSIEFFIEGGRSRQGTVGRPKYGILNAIIGGVDAGVCSDVLVVPVSINYDSVLEDESFARYALGAKKVPESLLGALWSSFKSFFFINLGQCTVRFGVPLSVRDRLGDSGNYADKIGERNSECSYSSSGQSSPDRENPPSQLEITPKKHDTNRDRLRYVSGTIACSVMSTLRAMQLFSPRQLTAYVVLEAKRDNKLTLAQLELRCKATMSILTRIKSNEDADADADADADVKSPFCTSFCSNVRSEVRVAVEELVNRKILNLTNKDNTRTARDGDFLESLEVESVVSIFPSDMAVVLLRYYASPLVERLKSLKAQQNQSRQSEETKRQS